MTTAGFRRLALALPEAVEGAHFGNPDFRVGGKIFATLSLQKEGYGVLLFSPEQQAGMVEAPDILEAALRTAWRRKAPKRLLCDLGD